MTEMTTVFEEIRTSFPHLKMELKRNAPRVDLRMDIPCQRGLAFDLTLSLQRNELQLRAGTCRLKWVPSTSADVVARFKESVQGMLSGRFRIVEHCRLGRAFRAELQRPRVDGWQTIGTWRRLHLPWGKESTRVLQNAGGADAI